MAKPFSFGSIHLEAGSGTSEAAGTPDPETPFRVAVLGDFSGRSSRGIEERGEALAARRPLMVDRDNLHQVLGKLGVELEMPVAGRIRFRELDDFHPDRLFARLPLFEKLREAQRQLSTSPAPARPPERDRAAPAPPGFALGGLLDQAVEETASRVEKRPARTKDEFQSWLEDRVAPHLAPSEDPQQAELRALVEKAASAQMRAVMHYPGFQALESAWRALFFLTRRVETDAVLKLYLIDVSKAELATDLRSAEDLSETGLYRLLAGSAPGSPWAVLAGNYTFSPEAEDLDLLARLGTIARALGAPWLAAADPRFVGCRSLASAPDAHDWNAEPGAGWQHLRQHPVASSVGLVLPRFLLRLPYGKDTEACEQFAFEEMGDAPEHESYLWGNAAFACVILLAESFSGHGWDFRPGTQLNIGRLPLYVHKRDGESVAQPCAEILMTERAARKILDQGLMPLASLKETDEVRLVRFQSIADPHAALAGRWG